jgi:tetratricopeptide (TPR) repeat protein
MAKLFLSYAREDAATAERLARQLERTSHDVRWDRELRGGASFGPEIERQLKECDVVIVLWSRAGVQSSWVRDEAAIGRDEGKLLPISVDGTEPPIGFRQFHALQWSAHDGTAARRIEHAVREIASERSDEAATAGTETSQRHPTRRLRLHVSPSACAAIALAVGASVLLVLAERGHSSLRVAVVPIASAANPIAVEYARAIAADMAPILAARADHASVIDPNADARSADYKLSVAVVKNGNAADASLSLSSRPDSGMIWSKNWNVPNLARADLKQQMSLVGTQAMLCAAEGDKGGLPRHAGALPLYISACVGITDSDTTNGDLSALLTKITQLAPRFTPARGLLAMVDADVVNEARSEHDPDPPGAVARARAAIAETRKLDPHSGKALLAEALLEPNPVKALPIIDRAIQEEPGTMQIHNLRIGILESLGRHRAAIEEGAQSIQIDPLSPQTRAHYIQALTYSGRFNQAREVLEQAQKIWPTSGEISRAAFSFYYRYGDPMSAEKLLATVQNKSDADLEPLRKTIAARIEPTPAKIEGAIAAFREMERTHPQLGNQYLLVAGLFGRTDEVYALLDDPKFKPFIAPQVLFRPEFGHVRADRRFMTIAAELGLVRYWKTSGLWPDFCVDDKLPYDCKAEAAKYH